ncbi:MAG: hydroxyacid dehydrogenase, partial [Sphingomonadales bacterium]|nr:hydroxyacid dehydrogenase [Sphingomonadales bacterium]
MKGQAMVPADQAVAERLRAEVPGLWVGAAEPRHLEEPRGRWRGQGIVAKPADVAQVSGLMRVAHAAG